MHVESSIIESIRTFFLTCPFLHDGRVNVDYLGEEMSYSIDPLPCDPVIQKYVDGGKKKQYQFAVCSKETYDEDARVNIENSGFYQGLQEWLEESSDDGELPELANEKQHATAVETLNSGYLYDAEANLATYRIEYRPAMGQSQQNLPVWRSSRHFQSPRTRPPMNASTWTRIPATAT